MSLIVAIYRSHDGSIGPPMSVDSVFLVLTLFIVQRCGAHMAAGHFPSAASSAEVCGVS